MKTSYPSMFNSKTNEHKQARLKLKLITLEYTIFFIRTIL